MENTSRFTFSSGLRTGLISMMVIGVISLVITYFKGADEYHTRFWSNFLINTVFFTGISFLALMFLAAHGIALSGWHVVFKRVWESYMQFIIVGLVLMIFIILGLYFNWHHLYHWADADSVAHDKVLRHKASFLNKGTYTGFTIIVLAIWYFFARKLGSISNDEDKNGSVFDYSHYNTWKKWAAALLPIGGFSSAFVVWQWVMSVDAHWYSTLFAWYGTISWLVAMIALTLMTIIYLKSKGYYEVISENHMHDLAKYLFGFSIFWTYLWFSQYMLIWYGNVGEETVYFKERLDNYRFLFFANLVINFVLPFFILMTRGSKRRFGTVFFVALIVFLGHWMDFFLMVKPGVAHTMHELSGTHEMHAENDHHEETIAMTAEEHGEDHAHADEHAVAGDHGEEAHGADHGEGHHQVMPGFKSPGLLEFGSMLGFLGLFLYITLSYLSRVNLLPIHDPYLYESYHHEI